MYEVFEIATQSTFEYMGIVGIPSQPAHLSNWLTLNPRVMARSIVHRDKHFARLRVPYPSQLAKATKKDLEIEI